MTKKAFRQHLNQKYGVCSNPQGDSKNYRPVTRKYGDYLYAQDKDMFNCLYQEWLASGA